MVPRQIWTLASLFARECGSAAHGSGVVGIPSTSDLEPCGGPDACIELMVTPPPEKLNFTPWPPS